MTNTLLHQLAVKAGNRLREERLLLATAESCTGGMVAAAMTDISGSSNWFERGFVTYSNQAKIDMIGVPAELIDKHGAVSEQVARAMAEGALRNSRAQLSLAITGVAGPGGGTPEKPVGLTYIGLLLRGQTPQVRRHIWQGDREAVKNASAQAALAWIIEALETSP